MRCVDVEPDIAQLRERETASERKEFRPHPTGLALHFRERCEQSGCIPHEERSHTTMTSAQQLLGEGRLHCRFSRPRATVLRHPQALASALAAGEHRASFQGVGMKRAACNCDGAFVSRTWATGDRSELDMLAQ